MPHLAFGGLIVIVGAAATRRSGVVLAVDFAYVAAGARRVLESPTAFASRIDALGPRGICLLCRLAVPLTDGDRRAK